MEDEKKKKTKGVKEHDPSKFIETEPKLDEAAAKGTAVITFGRMNPITIGHEKLVNKVVSEAAARKATPMVFLSHSEKPKTDPLSYDNKLKFAKKAFGKVIVKSKAKTIIEVAKSLSGKYETLVIVVGQDRLKEFGALMQKYNGKDYTFDKIEIVSAGSRDPDSDGVEGMSASKMRTLAASGDMDQFKKGLPKKLQRNAKEVYNAVRNGMDITEQLDEALSRAQRRKRAMAMRRAKARITAGRKRAAKRRATPDQLKGRAQRRAIMKLKDKFSRHKRYADLEPAEKERVEKRVAKINKNRIQRMAQKELIYVKRADRDKFKKTRAESFSAWLEAKMTNPQDPDVKDRPGTQPKPYYKGVAKDKKDDRARHFEKNAKKSDSDDSAYKPAPGDKEAKTKESKHTKKARAMGFTEDLNWEELVEGLDEGLWGQRVSKRPHMLMDKNNKPKFDKRFKMYKPKITESLDEHEIEDLMEATESFMEEWVCGQCNSEPCVCEGDGLQEDAAGKSLKKKAEKSGMPTGILRQVYNRGVAAWKGGHRPGTTPEQWGHARVNSFITKSSGTWGKADKDLADKVRKEETQIDEGILKPYHAISKQPWSKTVKDSKGTAGEYKQIAKGKDFGVWYAYRGSGKSFPHYVVKNDKIVGSGMTVKAALKDAGFKEKDLTHRSKFADGSPLNKGMKEEVELYEISKKTAQSYLDKTKDDDAWSGTRKAKNRLRGSIHAVGIKRKKESVDEVLDTPKAMDSYHNKAKAQSDRARNSATAKLVRGGKEKDISKEKNTIRKREKGMDMAQNVRAKQFRKSIGRGYGESVDINAKFEENFVQQQEESNLAFTIKGKLGEAFKEEKNKIREELKALKTNLNKLEGSCGSGAGEEGTPELVKKFKKDTPNA
jgi:nicotinic acid mononucleotide adenylyltransferase